MTIGLTLPQHAGDRFAAHENQPWKVKAFLAAVTVSPVVRCDTLGSSSGQRSLVGLQLAQNAAGDCCYSAGPIEVENWPLDHIYSMIYLARR